MSSPQLRITLAGSEHVVEAGTTAGAALAAALGAVLGSGVGVVAARVNGELRDLAWPLAGGDVVEPVDITSDDGRYILRHSTAHVMAQAVQELFPRGQARHRPAGRGRLLLRLRRALAVHPRRPEGHREAHAPDRQGRASGSPGGW